MINIRIWQFQDAPEQYRALSTNGGDEDWVAEVGPYPLKDAEEALLTGSRGLFALETDTVFAVDNLEEHELSSCPFHIFIGSHA